MNTTCDINVRETLLNIIKHKGRCHLFEIISSECKMYCPLYQYCSVTSEVMYAKSRSRSCENDLYNFLYKEALRVSPDYNITEADIFEMSL